VPCALCITGALGIMTDDPNIHSPQVAAGRLFRLYYRHCNDPDPDTLFQLLTALHSLNDRLKEFSGNDLHGIEEFIALKALRNFMHHQEEVEANVRIIPRPVAMTDLAFMCIVRREKVERAICNVIPKYRDQTRTACEGCFKWYGQAVNLNPCIFNCVVRVYEHLMSEGVPIPEKDITDFRDDYEAEEKEGLSHFVSGNLSVGIGEISRTYAEIEAMLPEG